MKNVRLKQMKLRNFKGTRDLTIDFNCKDTNIYGRNETGKTTIVDAFMWLFFNKDSSGASDFDIKTKNSYGEYLHNLEHSVEATLDVDGTETKFMKVYKEKYTKQRGSTTATFTGHTTDYFVDDVPKKKKEYDSLVNDLFDSKYFQIITDPLYFNEKMKWQDRRSLLIDICGDVDALEVVNSNKELSPLCKVMPGKTIDEYRLQLKSQMKPINDELKAIPIKINEAQLAIPNEIESIDEEKLSFINNRISELENQRTLALSGGAVAEKETELIKLRNKKLMLQQEVPNVKQLKDELYSLSIQEDSLQRKVERANESIKFKQSQQQSNEKQRDSLRNKYVEVNATQYDESQNICPHCKQQLPPDQIARFMEKFNINKSNELEKINTDGKALKEEFDKRADEIIILSNDVELNKRAINDLQVSIKEKQEEIDNIQNDFKAKQQPKLDAIDEKIVECERKIDMLKNNTGASTSAIDEEISMLKEQRSYIESIKAKQQVAEIQKKRIAELEAREKELADQYNHMDKMLYLTDLFIKTKVNMLTEKINSYFKLCNFKLFNEQVNGGVEECCEVTVDGVSYRDLNNAKTINAGLDVINTVCKHVDTQAPIFIDNCEAVNETIETESQQIRLYVTKTDESLRIEN